MKIFFTHLILIHLAKNVITSSQLDIIISAKCDWKVFNKKWDFYISIVFVENETSCLRGSDNYMCLKTALLTDFIMTKKAAKTINIIISSKWVLNF